MHKLFLAAVLVFGLTGCSDKPVVFTATHQLAGRDLGVTVKMTLNHFSEKDRQEGDGQIEVVKKPGTAWTGSEGTFPIAWRALAENQVPGQGRAFRVVVPSLKDAFKMDAHPINRTIFGIGATETYYCFECELLRSGAGLGILPGVFIKTDDS